MNAPNLQHQFSRDADEIDIRAVLDVLIKNVKTIVAVTAVFVLVGALYALLARPVYSVDITVQVESNDDLAGAAAGNLIGGLSSLFDVKSTDDGEMEILHSRLVTDKVVDDLRLYIDAQPRYFPVIGAWIARHGHTLSQPGLLGIGGYAWGAESIAVNQFDVPKDFEEDSFTVTALGAGRYRLSGSDLDTDATGQVGTPLKVATPQGDITLLVAQLNGRTNAQFVVKRYSKLKVLDKLQKDLTITEKGKDQSGVIGVTYENPDPALASAVLNEIADNYVRQNADRKAATAEKSLQFLNAQLPDVERQLRSVEDRLNAYQNKHEVVDLSEQAKAILTQSVAAQSSLFELEQKRKELTALYTPEHPALAALDQQIAAARANMDSFNGSIQRLPDAQQNIVRLRRDVTVETDLYVGLLNSMQQLRLATASKIGNVRVIDHAVIPDESVKPKRVLIVAIAAALGLLCGVSTAVVRAALFGGLTDPMDIERDAMLNVIATIPLSGAQRQLMRPGERSDLVPSILALARPQEPAVEALRSLCTALQFALLERPDNNLVLMTGPSGGIGKSFISANVATLIGLSKKRVLLIDGDLRRGHLATDFGVPGRVGLTNVLRDATPLGEAIVADITPNVDFLPTGPLVSQPVELFSAGGLADVLAWAAQRYDVVLLDAPPVLPVTDATVFAPYAGIVLLAARSGMTSNGEILESVKRIERVGAKVTGVVFNGFRPGLRSAQYGNYGGYAYRGNEQEAQLGSR
ncbi:MULTISPECIES: polysaccharide biosynthesis tyrosine autokinase [Paraburkholderia]|uniref:polysaccharide biosynthesis tyrosine autokinase n=1 Tax=Paraburkholderia TaxID=1822464 RepID=UPI00225B9634|nr:MULTISPECIES: polysaccharide biosynthesis tyrosine autokinase [Paraburkholderia]MCX4161553.1 polysaccharide biosynthesis tyrosine autokinase [Paraburkholderia megapolitana]MDN7157049.1 polysaccharide biosynthesis tyrosine autokinase [Paraburkholderia sp. CHISQ3]MDQ6494094.1 polysaccharide biosynthesis tyrosine autokinase [Paraburkholderia megapolitana]